MATKRSKLADFYGIKKVVDPLEGRRADPFDIEHPAFNPETYLARLSKEVSLNELVQKHTDLATEIRELDSDMKTLVYENYSKFNVATDTIKQIKFKIENMENQVSKLVLNIDKISKNCDSINKDMDGKQVEIIQLDKTNSVLKKLDFVFELPNLLNTCLKQKQYRQAVVYYQKTHYILKSYHDMKLFSKIAAESNLIMKNCVKKILSNINANSSLMEIYDCVEMLVGAMHTTPIELARFYLSKFIYLIPELI